MNHCLTYRAHRAIFLITEVYSNRPFGYPFCGYGVHC
jgi:hypothetical protein